jgi:hypothetical protein
MEFKGLIYNEVDYSDRYKVSDNGEIYSLKSNRILKTRVNKNGYVVICIALGSRENRKSIRINRAVACTFIPNTENKPEVNHKDTNKLNNHISNLEWNTSKENTQHASRNGRMVNKNKKLVMNVTINEVFDSVSLAGTWLLTNYNNNGDIETFRKCISRCCNGDRPTAYGYKWKFI